jgi:hypothetical protein
MKSAKVLVLGLLAITACGCDSSCENAQEKLDECDDEVARELKKRPNWMLDFHLALPIGVSDECNELDQCVSECVNAAECPAIAHVMVHGGAQTDPNDTRPSGTAKFSVCIEDCILEAR